jgi:hypothetical protein
MCRGRRFTFFEAHATPTTITHTSSVIAVLKAAADFTISDMLAGRPAQCMAGVVVVFTGVLTSGIANFEEI